MGKGQSLATVASALLLALVAALGLFGNLEVTAIAVAVVVVAVLLTLFVRSVMSSDPHPRVVETDDSRTSFEAPDLRRLIALAIGVRIVGAFVINLTKFNRAVAPDSDGFAFYGRMLATSWRNPAFTMEGIIGYNPRSFYQILNAVIYYVFDVNPGLPLSLVNAFVGTLAAWLISRIALRVYGSEAARRAFILAAFYPSLVLWTSINLRDAWSFALLAGSLLCAQALRQQFSVSRLLMMVGCFAVMPFVRGYLVPVVGLGILCSYMVVRIRRLPVAIVSAAALTIFLVLMANQLDVKIGVDLEDRLQTIDQLRAGLAYGNSAFDTSISIATPGGALRYLPIGIANFLFSPFPWRISSWRQVMALPEALLTYWMMAHAARGLWQSARHRLPEVALLIFAALAITCSYGLVEGNEGTAFRHRAHALLVFFVFAAVSQTSRARQRQTTEQKVPEVSLAGSVARPS